MTRATSHPPGAEAYFMLLLPVCVIINSQTLKFHSPVSTDPLIARLLAFPKGALHMSDRAVNPRHVQRALSHTTVKKILGPPLNTSFERGNSDVNCTRRHFSFLFLPYFPSTLRGVGMEIQGWRSSSLQFRLVPIFFLGNS